MMHVEELDGIDAVRALQRITSGQAAAGDYPLVLRAIVRSVMPDAVHPNGEIGARIHERLAVMIPRLHRLVGMATGRSFSVCTDGLDSASASSHTLLDVLDEVCAHLEAHAELTRWASELGQEVVLKGQTSDVAQITKHSDRIQALKTMVAILMHNKG